MLSGLTYAGAAHLHMLHPLLASYAHSSAVAHLRSTESGHVGATGLALRTHERRAPISAAAATPFLRLIATTPIRTIIPTSGSEFHATATDPENRDQIPHGRRAQNRLRESERACIAGRARHAGEQCTESSGSFGFLSEERPRIRGMFDAVQSGMRHRRVLAPALATLVVVGEFAGASGCSSELESPFDASTGGADVDAARVDGTVVPPGEAGAIDARDARGDAENDASLDGTMSDTGVDADTGVTDASFTDAAEGGGPDAGDTGSPWFDIYDPNSIPTIELTFDAAAMAILSNPSTIEADQKKWAHGSFKCGNVVIADVGVRRKGSSTFRALPQKAAFKIRFDKYVAGQRFLGLTDLTLNNSMSDPTFIAERLAYHTFRSVGLPAQRANSAEVVINGAPYGLYVNVETPNQDFLRRAFVLTGRSLYEVNYGSQWLPGVEDGFDENVGDGTKSDVTALLQAVQAASDATLLVDVASHLDTNEWLDFSATEAAVGHYDGYAYGVWGSHNYFMAANGAGVFSLVPWSTDLTFSDRQTVVNANVPQNTSGGGPTLLGRCKATTTCWATYKTRVQAILAKFETLDLVNLAKAWHAQVDAHVVADPKREAPLPYYDSETAKLYTWIAARPSVVRAQLGL